MKKKPIAVMLFQFCFSVILSCTGDNSFNGINEMNFLVSNYYKRKLSLINGKNIAEEKLVLDLTGLDGRRVIQTGFLTPNTVYVVFEGVQEKLTEMKVYIRIYDILSFNWEDVFVYRSEYDNIRIIDMENAAGYFSGYLDRNRLMYLDFENQTYGAVFEFSDNEEIITLDCRSSSQFVLVNTYENNYIHRYYYIDKYSHEKIVDGYGHIYKNKYSNYIIHVNNSNVYLLEDLFKPMERNEIHIEDNKYFSNAIAIDKNSFILCLYSTRPNFIGNLLFGGDHVINRYDYQFIRISDNNEHDLGYRKAYGYSNKLTNKVLFDVMGSAEVVAIKFKEEK